MRAAAEAGHEVVACGPIDRSAPDIEIHGLDGRYRAMGVAFRELPMERQGTNPVSDVVALFRLCRLMQEVRPDVVLSYSAKSSLYGSIAARLTGVPRSYSVITGLGYLFNTDSGERRLVRAAATRLLGIALSGNNRVFFQNPDDRDLFLKLRLLKDGRRTVVVNGSGVDLERHPEAPFPAYPLTFLMVARLQYHKGVAEYLQAASILKKRYPGARFQLLGPLDDHPSAVRRDELEKWRREGIVEFLGGTPDIRPFLERCHVFVLPSYREGTSRSALEAMATGRPVVTTDVPGCRETVIDGENGFLVRVKDSASLADGMRKFVESPGLIETMGKRSRRIAEEKYDVVDVVGAMMRAMNL